MFLKVFEFLSGHEVNGLSLSDIKGDKAKNKKGRVVILVLDTFPVLHFYQVSLKYFKESLTDRADTKSMDYHCQI